MQETPEEIARDILRWAYEQDRDFGGALGVEWVDRIAAALQSYAAARAKEARERAAAHIEMRASEIEDGQDAASLSAWVARIFRDEAKAIRELE